ncbi:RNA polymerase sigma-70 factor [Pedobacter arcticus]|uniref:RNA polymerase sigma-70 factor n=1 Tax=Pedobacter arcticus TaxID=752140 RepID=UPI0002FA49D3|nr:RNA polymerase sigma-70 factor [Pedobacter arcticus]
MKAEINLIYQINTGNELVFEKVFKQYFKALQNYAYTILNDLDIAEEMVQNVFLKIWEKREKLPQDALIGSYLYKSVYHESLNWLRHEKVKRSHQQHTLYSMKDETDNAENHIKMKQLEEQLQKALNKLPQQCRTIFQMSRFDELRYREIAAELGISIKTVENQMGKALRLMRLKLVEFLPVMIGLINSIFILK